MANFKAFVMGQCEYALVLFMKLIVCCIVISVSGSNKSSRVEAIHWDHSVDLNDDYRVLWNVVGQEITFEVQVRTLGYVGLGFSYDGKLPGSDVAIGWVSQGQVHFQDRHVKRSGDVEPVVDPSQDYVLMLGYENATHTVMRFKRKLETCDTSYDIAISNDTMRVIYMYDENDPRYGSVVPGNMQNSQEAYKGYRSLFLTQKPHQRESIAIDTDPNVKVFELRNEDVELPQGDDTLYWCKMFKLQDIHQKSHVVKYEPVFDSASSEPYLQHIILYECQGSSSALELMSREQGRPCYRPNNPSMACNAIVATWAKGSEGFVFPPETGYPLDLNQARFYLMETHYNNPRNVDEFGNVNMRQKADSSGLKLYYTDKLRKYDAGVLSIGMDPNWRHIIPPLQHHVISEGHCIEDCTRRAFPRQGVNMFAIMMRTHMIGKEVRLRHIRNNVEYPSIAIDRNIDPNYQEFRRLPASVRVMPGDRLISECTYDSSSRDQITLGGLTTREESCIVLTYYYPRQKRLTTCHSLPSLPTVLHSLGIEELAIGSNPVLIALPPELAGMSLESRLISYDWKQNFNSFQQVTRNGSFKAICWDAKNVIIPNTDHIEGSNPNITKAWNPPSSCIMKSNSKSMDDVLSDNGGTNSARSNLDNNSRRRQNSSNNRYSNSNNNSYNRNRNNNSNRNRNYPYDDNMLGEENTEENFIGNNRLNDGDSSVIGDDGDDNEDLGNRNIIDGVARSKVSRSSSAATETMGLNGSSASMAIATIVQTILIHSFAYLLIRIYS